MVYGDFNYLAKRTASDKILRHKPFNIAKYPRYDGNQRGLWSTFYKFFYQKSKGNGFNTHAKFIRDLKTIFGEPI